MSVPEQTPFIEYTANGTTTVFPVPFQCDKAEYLIVLVDDVEPVVGAWSLSNGAVVFNTAPENGKKITIQRNTPFSRTADYQSYNNSFRPPAVNKDFDLIWWKLQELGVADWILSNRIDALKNYVDDRDDELRAYLLEEIRKQGVALDQLEDYYNYLMQRLAEIAVNGGWESSFVSYGSITQKKLNDGIETVDDLRAINNPAQNMRVHVKRYSSLSKFVGGVNYIWNSESSDEDNGFETIASSTNTTGRWKAIFKDNVINAWSVGYVGDGTTSNHLVHEKVSEFLKNSNESWKLVFSNGTFLFNHKHNRFWLVSHVNYHVKSTATIKGGIAFDDDIVWFASQYDTANPLKSTSITGKGTFDMSDTGMMASAYKVRVMFYMLNPINLLVDGLKFTGGDFSQVFVTGETGYTSDDVLIKNCRFDIPVSASPSSKNDDHTTIYTQATNTVVRNNRFYSSNIRARCISTAIEFHEKDGVFESNLLDDLAVGMYIAPQERIDCSNIRVLNNTCRLSNLFVSFWANNGADRIINDIVIKGNKVKQNLYPDAATLAANGLIVKTEGLRFLSFIHESGFSATNNYVSNGIDVSGNTFEHSLTGTNDQCQLLYLFCNPPENINFNNNTLKVNAFINSSGLVNSGLDSIVISKNSIDSRYLSTTVAPFSLNISSMSKCYFDMSDIEYLDITSRPIPMFSFGSVSIPMTLNTIIEGKESRAIYNRSTYPSALFGNANANNVGIVFQTTLTIPSGVTGANVIYTNTSSFDKFSKAEVLYCGVHLDSSIVIPDTLRKRHGDISAFVGVGYTNPALSSASTNDVWLYIS
ncbi:hypothetical protein [Acinetobacter baumannii]|uniref:hypothetical protein n=1 Tax=Acinetobacter baumannii TaxID=470 RepID=UPI00280D7908|nr:hypothetical protein [Acinetobacter baumannii]MDQ8877028.1 hypothetical protein [Acinetobacter baumannii]MDQ8888019.1 hypothetical protein [Acinetobacter baumannii]MDQ8895053.1 hypothetical protein [Acinetobacter baumannii]